MPDADLLDEQAVADDVERLATEGADAAAVVRLARSVAASARAAGATGLASGRWLANTLIDVAPRIKVRDLETLQGHLGVTEPSQLADELVKNATRASAAVGAASGALMSAEQFVPPAWLAFPLELAVETLAVAAIELKLVAELHEVYGRPVRGSASDRTVVLVKAWAERRGVTPAALARTGGIAEALGKGTRHELVRLVRRRLLARFGRNISSLAPLFAGAVAGAEVNRRATRALGEAVLRDLAATSPSDLRV